MGRKPTIRTYEANPLALKFPKPPDDLLDELRKDIEEHGMAEPIQLDAEGRILDGWTRYTAMQDSDLRSIRLWYRKWKGRSDPERYVEYVVTHNLLRRHHPLTASQRAALQVSLREQAADGRPKTVQKCTVSEAENRPDATKKADRPVQPQTKKAAAAEAGVSPRMIGKARKLHDEKPELEQAVIDGEIGLDEALAEPEAPPAPPEDPTDEYGNIIPERCRRDFADTTRFRQWMGEIQGTRTDVEKMVEANESLTRFIGCETGEQWREFDTCLKTAAKILRQSRPYCLCQCSGDGCKLCFRTGWLPKERYQQCVPIENKWVKK